MTALSKTQLTASVESGTTNEIEQRWKELDAEHLGCFISACIAYGATDVVFRLLRSGLDANISWGELDSSLLHSAAMNNDANACRMLLKHGANASARNKVGETPLHLLIDSLGVDCEDFDSAAETSAVQLLLEAGASASVRDDNGLSAIDVAKSYELHGWTDVLGRFE